MKKLFTITIFTIGLIAFTNAQGITNTLGGNSAADKFIVENSDSEAGLVITGEGSVGIGTSNPLSKLHIYDDVNSSLSLRLQNTSTGTGASTKLYFDSSNHAGIAVFGSSYSGSENVMRIFNNRNSPDGTIDFVLSGGKKMVINNNGYVGIGTTNPLSKLSVGGDGHSDYTIYGEAAESTGRGVYGHATGSAGFGVFGHASGLYGKGVVGHGNFYDFYATGLGTDYGAASSIRWKRNIVAIDNPLEKLAELRGVYFDWDEEHGGHHDIGCIAEEVGKVLPEIVVYEENGIDADGMDYSKLTPLLIEVAKAQQTLIEELTERINFLESK